MSTYASGGWPNPMLLHMPSRRTNNFMHMNRCFYSSSAHNSRSTLTHINDEGKAAMVDVSTKKGSLRVAMAFAHVKVKLICFNLLQ